MGAVYRATDLVLRRTVAIKILKEQTGEEVGRKIRLEAQILARLLHENIVRLYDFGEADGTYYFVMEEVDGSSFSRRWKRIGLPERLRVIAQVADALDYAHHQGVIHRLLAKDPEARPGSGSEVAAALRELIAANPTPRTPRAPAAEFPAATLSPPGTPAGRSVTRLAPGDDPGARRRAREMIDRVM